MSKTLHLMPPIIAEVIPGSPSVPLNLAQNDPPEPNAGKTKSHTAYLT